MSTEIFVGIDVSKDSLEVGVYPSHLGCRMATLSRGWRNSSTPQSAQPAADRLRGHRWLRDAGSGLPGCGRAAGGGRQRPAGRDFAESIGRLAKTDAIDAGVIARFAEAVRPELRGIKDAASQQLSALVTGGGRSWR